MLSKSSITATIVVPEPVTSPTQAETLDVDYQNTGSTAVPAPVLVLHAIQNGHEDALMTLDSAQQGQALNTSATPPEYSQTIEFVASGTSPGVLEPGESGSVSVYLAGWLKTAWDYAQPAVSFRIDLITADSTMPVNWPAIESSSQPAGVSAPAWSSVIANLESKLGSTWGSYVTRLDQDAAYLAGLGETVDDVNTLWSFEIQQANGLGPVPQLSSATDLQVTVPGSVPLEVDRSFSATVLGRNTTGSFGAGWSLGGGWERTLTVGADGSVIIADPSGSQRVFAPVGSGYVSQPGDHGILASLGGGIYTLTELDGTVSEFRQGRLSFVQDSNGNRITAGYTNNLLTILSASSGAWIKFFYTSTGLIREVTNSVGQAATYEYDPTNTYLLSATNSQDETTEYLYDSTTKALKEITYTDGSVQTLSYDSEGRLSGGLLEGGSAGIAVSYSYGPQGQVTVTDALGDQTTYDYNQLGLIARVTNPLAEATEYQYDATGDLTKVTNASGQTSTYVYDSQGNVVQSTDARGNSTEFTYGALGTLTSLAAPNGTTSYDYDSSGNLLSTTYADGTVESSAFNPVGEITQSTDGDGHATSYTYDLDGRLISETFSDGTENSYTYDAYGNMVSATNATGTIRLSYSTTNLLTQIVYPDGATLSYSYDGAGRRTKMVDQSGNVVNYTYNLLGELSGLTDDVGNPIVSYAYDADGRLSKVTDGNGAYALYAYDRAGDIAGIVNYAPGGVINSSFAYVYNALGLCTQETTTQGSWSYTYDAAGELTGAVFTSNDPAQIANQSLQYFYDASGNRTETIVNGMTTDYTSSDRNEYTQVGSTTYSYDGNGSLVAETGSSGATSFTYNAAGQLVGIQGPGGVSSSFTYDPLGNLYSTMQNGQKAQYLVDPTGLGNIVGEYNSSGAVLATFNYGLGLVSLTSADQTSTYYQFDALGSTADLTDTAGSVVDSYSYLPFGGIQSAIATAMNSLQFVGASGVTSQIDGLSYMRARFYDPTLGRFMSQDPLGPANRASGPYTYANNNPESYVDPTGYQSVVPAQSLIPIITPDGTVIYASPNAPKQPTPPQDDQPDLGKTIIATLIIEMSGLNWFGSLLKGLADTPGPDVPFSGEISPEPSIKFDPWGIFGKWIGNKLFPPEPPPPPPPPAPPPPTQPTGDPPNTPMTSIPDTPDQVVAGTQGETETIDTFNSDGRHAR